MKIVVRTPNWIGDTLMALPAIESLRRNFPSDEIWIAAPAWVREIFAGEEWSGRLWPLDSPKRGNDFFAAAAKLRAPSFDAGLLLTNSFGSAAVFALAGIPERWGYAREGRGFLLTKKVRARRGDEPSHMVRYYLDLVEGLGWKTHPAEIRLTVTSSEAERGRALLTAAGLDPGRPLAILNPGAAFGPAKRWPADRFAALARILQDRHGLEIAVTGGVEDRLSAQVVQSAVSRPAADLTGRTTLRELLGVIRAAAVFVTNDTGPMHMANALRVPVVAVFGPTEPAVTAPYHEPRTILKKDVVCWPCLYRECPYDHRCMLSITAEETAEAAARFL